MSKVSGKIIEQQLGKKEKCTFQNTEGGTHDVFNHRVSEFTLNTIQIQTLLDEVIKVET